jgi:hypothetical protein
MTSLPLIHQVSPQDLPSDLVGIMSDIDDTLTLHGRMIPEAFQMLQTLRDQGLKVVLITGRPAGWVDHIARMWPVDGVVGENGGLWFYMSQGKLVQSYLTDVSTRIERRAQLDLLAHRILERVPGCALASDQAFRALDLAIDFCEDVPPLNEDAIDQIVALFEEAGAIAKVSSIHVNGWFGQWDKLTGCEAFLKEAWGHDLPSQKTQWAYFGDSANDEPMFDYFPYSIGVANVKAFLPRMKAHPQWITHSEGGLGFVEGVQALLKARSSKI